jgi:hypothetical protein
MRIEKHFPSLDYRGRLFLHIHGANGHENTSKFSSLVVVNSEGNSDYENNATAR